MINLLITGANGFVGRQLVLFLTKNKKFQVFATSAQEDKYKSEGYTYIQTDLTNKEEVEQLLLKCKPDFIIHTAALSSIPECENHPEKAELINVQAVKHLTKFAHQAHFIQVSTDFVFDGTNSKPYTEEDTPNPINIYGETKRNAELYLTKHLDQYTLIRIVVVYGKPLEGQHTNIVEIIRSKLEKNEEVSLVSDQWRTPTYVGDICHAIESIIEKKATGIYHICGSEVFSIYELGIHIAKHLGKDVNLIRPVVSHSDKTSPKRPPYTALSNAKARKELNYKTTSITTYLDK